MSPEEPELRSCAICGRVLDHYSENSGGGWFHTEMDADETDHIAVPVGVNEIRTTYRCDFCLVDISEPWVVPARTFSITPASRSEGDWAACETCAGLILINDWNGLARRCTDAVIREDTDRQNIDPVTVEQTMKHLHRLLRKNITGVPVAKEIT